MKRILCSAVFFLTPLMSFSQYDLDINREKSVSPTERRSNNIKAREEIGNCKFIPFHEYTEGLKFYFPKDDFKLKYDDISSYTDYHALKEIKKGKFQTEPISYKNLAGKQFIITKVEDRGKDYFAQSYIILKQVDSAFTIEHKQMIRRESLKSNWEKDTYTGQTFVLPDAIYTADIDGFKEKYLDKEFYSNFPVGGKKYQKVKIIQVGAGSEHSPIRVVVENQNGNKEQIDFCTCGTNVPTIYTESNDFLRHFRLINPKITYKGSDEMWETICTSKIMIGMTEEDLILSWGRPEKINKTVVSGIVSEQYVYNNQYVYVENGKVTSFQSQK